MIGFDRGRYKFLLFSTFSMLYKPPLVARGGVVLDDGGDKEKEIKVDFKVGKFQGAM